MERPFFAMNTGTGSGTPEEQAALACEMGFDGIGWGIWRAPEVRRVCEQEGADLWSIYCVLRLDEGDSPRMRQLLKAMGSLAGGPGMIWLALEHPKAEDDAFDVEQAVQTLLTPILQLAQDTGVELALYPHQGFWISTTEDALVLCERFKHPRLGVCFNLSHFLAGHETSDPGPLLQRALPYLLSVTVNGANSDGEGWDTLIQPLGRGDFDLGGLLNSLDRLGWVGPVGLQAFGIKLPAREHLALSWAAWDATQKK
jgi:sugar phosphate isomerase/epimerase